MPGVITTCAKCGAQYSWNTDFQEYPDCPQCGYNAMKIDKAKRDKCSSAAERGDLAGVKQGLRDPDVRKNLNAGPLTILHHAVSGNQIEVVKYLLSEGAEPDRTYPQAGNETPLHIAAAKGLHEIAKVLIEGGARVDARDSNGKKPIDRASDDATIAMLRPYDSKMSSIADFFAAVKAGQVEKVEQFLKNGMDPNQKDPNENDFGEVRGIPPLCYVAEDKAHGKQMAELLLKYGADPNIRRNAEISALHDAVMGGRAEIEHGADVNIRTWNKETPLHYACDNLSGPDEGRIELMQLLIEKGADVNALNDERETPLHNATHTCPNDDFTILKVLLDAGADASIRSTSGDGNRPIDLCWQEEDKPKRDFLCQATGLPGPRSLEKSARRAPKAAQEEKPKEGCFIATACYGSPVCAEVLMLRDFRDQHLAQSLLGRAAVRLYYYLSPPIAAALSRRPFLRTLVRHVLVAPAVRLVAAFSDSRNGRRQA